MVESEDLSEDGLHFSDTHANPLIFIIRLILRLRILGI